MTKQQILMIDDEPETVDMLKQFLGLFEFEVTGSSTGTEGMQLAVSMVPQAILLDLNLPDGDGFQICRLMRHHPNLRTTPIVILSARVGKDDEIKSLASGATAYLHKPIDLNRLVEELRHTIQTGHVPAAGIRQEPPPSEADSEGPDHLLRGKIQSRPAQVDSQSPLKGKRSTVHIPGMYIPREEEEKKEDKQ